MLQVSLQENIYLPSMLENPEQKKSTSYTPVGEATDKKLQLKPTKMHTARGHHRVCRPTHWRAVEEGSIVINHDWVKTKHADCRMTFKLYPIRL